MDTGKLRVLNRRKDLRGLGTLFVGLVILSWYFVRVVQGHKPGSGMLGAGVGFVVMSLLVLSFARFRAK